MNRHPRVLLIGRHYWPHGSIDSAAFLMQTATALHRRGLGVEVFTPKFASYWPERITVREIAVHRPVGAARSDWSIGRYVRGLSSWLQQHGGRYDVLFADSMREESSAVVDVAQKLGIKSALRCRGWGTRSDIQWWETSRAARKCEGIAKQADMVLAPSAASQRELLIRGFDPGRIARIDNGYAATAPPTLERRRRARLALAHANGDLYTETETPVVLCAAPMIRGDAIDMLIRSTHTLVTRYPDLRVWFVGDGTYRDTMYQYLRSEGVRASIAMPGSFCEMEDVFSAADVFVQLDEDGLEAFFPLAVSHELPVVALRNESILSLVDPFAARHEIAGYPNTPQDAGTRGSSEAPGSAKAPGGAGHAESLVNWCLDASPKATRLAISSVLDELSVARSRAAELRRLLLRSRPLATTTDAYVGLLQRLASQVPPGRRSTETETVS